MTNKTLWLLISYVTIYIVVAFGTYGTGDVKLWLSWAEQFTDSGFWQNFRPLSDIPLFNTIIVYWAGIISKIFFGSVDELTFPGSLKLIVLPLLLGCCYFIARLTNKISTIASILLNPAIILNLVILGYLDIVFIFWYFACLYFYRRSIFIFGIFLVTGFFTKPQWLLFLPILGLFGFLTAYKTGHLKKLFLGTAVGVLIVLIVIIYGTTNLNEVFYRLESLEITYKRTVGGQIFVVANFPNLWQVVNAFVHNSGILSPLSYWEDRQMSLSGRYVFYSAAIVYFLHIMYKIFKFKLVQFSDKDLPLILSASIWVNMVYAFFNTSVHENHLIATIFFSTMLYYLFPTAKRLFLVAFFTIFNFVNLFYFYGFGISGIFVWRPVLNVFDLNISLVLVAVFGAFLIYFSIRLFRATNRLLGF